MNGFDPELQKALKLSEETFAKEQSLREQARQLEQDIENKKLASRNDAEAYDKLIQLMQWRPLFVNHGVGAGLQNLGNSCFMNATLQCLAYTPALAQLLCEANHSKQCKSRSFCALCAMERLVPSLLLGGKQTVIPRKLFRNLPAINDLLTPGCQEDAHEFIQSLLDRLETAFDASAPASTPKPMNPIRKLFTGATKTSIECVKCRRVSVTEEPFCCLSLEIDKSNVDLCEALEIFTRDELLRGDDKYSCGHCQRKCVAHKRLTLSKLPPVLVLHLKRFSVHFEAAHHRQGSTRKMAAHVAFPETLDFKALQRLIHDADRERALIDAEYELFAVLVHSGPQLGYGHYYALVKAPDGHWFRCNDAQVMAVSAKHVLSEQGYVVFYRRKTTNLMRCELKRMQRKQPQLVQPAQEAHDQAEEKVVDAKDLEAQQVACLRRIGEQAAIVRGYENVSGDLDAETMAQIEEISERMAQEKARLRRIEAALQVSAMRKRVGCKVDTGLLTNDYFASKCGASEVQDGVLVERIDEEQEMAQGLSEVPDRASYVKVPPMAERPVATGDQEARGHADNGSPEAVELFWPPTQL